MLIDKRGIKELMNIKMPYRKLSKHTLPFFLLVFLLSTNYLLNISFIIDEASKTEFKLSMAFIALGSLEIVLFIFCKASNPGFITADSPKSHGYLFSILKKYKPADICFDCQVTHDKFRSENRNGRDTARYVKGVSVSTITTVRGWRTVWVPIIFWCFICF
jgi:hypothetical protein